jgi:hypothetical protein
LVFDLTEEASSRFVFFTAIWMDLIATRSGF